MPESAPAADQPLLDSRSWCLCLSGGGFRATLFHLGGLIRLNQLGILNRVSVITSVSGGSILNGVLATRWRNLKPGAGGVYTNFGSEVVAPVVEFCGADLRTRVLFGERLNPANWGTLLRDWFSVSANLLAKHYERLYRLELAEVPPPGADVPRFVFCATNVATGVCWHFHGGPQGRMGDYYTGYCSNQEVRVSAAVAASSAFPPGFSAFRLRLPRGTIFSRIDPWGRDRPPPLKRGRQLQGGTPRTVRLTDGGVYDNLAVEPIWNNSERLLVSDAGHPFVMDPAPGQALIPRLHRAADISMEQVAAVRKRWLVADFQTGKRVGTIWTLNTRLGDFPGGTGRGYGEEACDLLHRVRTDLNDFSAGEIGCLINHGYSLADAAIQSWVPVLVPTEPTDFDWPEKQWSNDPVLRAALGDSDRRWFARSIIRYLFKHTVGI